MSLASKVVDADSKDQLFLVVLLVSCLLHGIAILVITSFKPKHKNDQLRANEEVSVTLAPYQQPDISVSIDEKAVATTATDTNRLPLSEGPTNSTSDTALPATPAKTTLSTLSTRPRKRKAADGSAETRPVVTKPLDLNYDIKEDTFWQRKQEALTGRGKTSNGATIVSRIMLKLVQQARKHNDNTLSTGDQPDSSSFPNPNEGESRIVKIGNRCFILTEANPLDSISRDTWARIKCKY